MRTENLINTYLKEQMEILIDFPTEDVAKLMLAVEETYRKGRSVFVFGNGGGADIASHFASDLAVHPFVSEDKSKCIDTDRLKVHCLNTSPGLITRLANDIGFDYAFHGQLVSYNLNRKDLVIAFSGSGNSPNVVKALEYAKLKGATTVLVGGHTGGKSKQYADICILIPGNSQFPGQTGANDNCFHIEDFQSVIAHMITGILKERVNG